MADRPVKRNRTLTRLRVLRTEWLTPHLVRVVAGGDGLARFVNNDYTDRYVKLVFRQPGVEYPEPFDIDAIRRDLPREAWPVTRTYTIRYHDPVRQELAIDFVYHGEVGLAGPWAAGLKPGDEVMFFGPGGAYAPNPDADWHLLVGDESALPAVGAALSQIPAGVPVYAFLEVADATEELALETPGEARIHWVHRDGVPAGHGAGLLRAVQGFDFPTGTVHAFVHGETGLVKQLRRHLLAERNVPREALSISGYWRLGMNEDGFQAAKAADRAAEAAAEQAAAGQRSTGAAG